MPFAMVPPCLIPAPLPGKLRHQRVGKTRSGELQAHGQALAPGGLGEQAVQITEHQRIGAHASEPVSPQLNPIGSPCVYLPVSGSYVRNPL